MHAILDDAPVPAVHWVRASNARPGVRPQQRLDIYQHNARSNFFASLRSSYPVTHRLVGDDYFVQCVRAFHRQQASTSGDLLPAGALFARFLTALHLQDEYRYLGDVARLEWLCQESLLAEDHRALDLEKLAAVSSQQYEDLQFSLAASVRLFSSPYPCGRIWRANSAFNRDPEPIDLRAGPTRIALMRFRAELCFHCLSSAEHAFLSALGKKATFADAVAIASSSGEFDATSALQRFVAAAIIADFV